MKALPESIVKCLDLHMPFEEEKFYNGCQVADFSDIIQNNWYRHGLESMALALYCAGVAEEVILDSITTAIDAFVNNC